VSEVLIVDDDADLAELLEEVLVDHGIHTRRARNGEQGLQELQKHVPDAVVLDVEMPVLDGPAMAMRMWLNDRGLERVPIVLVSGAVGLPEIAAKVGTPYFLGKPYTLDQVCELCDRALAEHLAPQHDCPKH
jgi:CheY-like chemotaxis protein